MRFIFVDEAGISQHEPVTVVVGLIADADKHLIAAEGLVEEILGGVPNEFAEDFVFSAKSVFANMKYRERWSLTDRLFLLKQMMSVPRRIGMAISISAKWRGANQYNDFSPKLRPDQWDHFMAFLQMIGIADRNIRTHAGYSEVGTVVAEDMPEMRKFLRIGPKILRDLNVTMSPEHLRHTVSDKALGYLSQSGDMRVQRIRKTVHFVEKDEDNIVKVADACAYGLRRFFCGEDFGDEIADAILGDKKMLRDFQSPGGAICRWPAESAFPGIR